MTIRLCASQILAYGTLFSGCFLFAVEITPETMEKKAANLDVLISSVLEKSGKTLWKVCEIPVRKVYCFGRNSIQTNSLIFH